MYFLLVRTIFLVEIVRCINVLQISDHLCAECHMTIIIMDAAQCVDVKCTWGIYAIEL